jgi:hypothetical protein
MIHIDKKLYKGAIVAESLKDKNILRDINVLKVETSDDGEWHIYMVVVPEEFFNTLCKNINDGTWYAHFWNNRDVVAVFKNKIISFNFDDKNTWGEVISYGRSLNIPEEQLDFIIDDFY